jgi:uncharacterized protein YlaI
MIEDTLFYELIFGETTMNSQDLAVYQHAQALANSGQFAQAHQIFCDLRLRNLDVEILFGIATTTSNPVEAREVIDMISSQQPYHPRLRQLEALHTRKIDYPPTGPVLLCPYCEQRLPALVKSKISTGGWIWFAAFFVIFLCILLAPRLPSQESGMEISTFFFLAVSIVGLFTIHKRIYICGSCNSKIADTH